MVSKAVTLPALLGQRQIMTGCDCICRKLVGAVAKGAVLDLGAWGQGSFPWSVT